MFAIVPSPGLSEVHSVEKIRPHGGYVKEYPFTAKVAEEDTCPKSRDGPHDLEP